MLNEDQTIDTAEKNSMLPINDNSKKIHPWRICPIGKHYVRVHPEHTPSSKEHPTGEIVTIRGHCARNPSHKNLNKQDIPTKDILSFEELQFIAKTYFMDLKGPPKAHILPFDRADEFDPQIRGWVMYWNQVFDAKDPLDPNLVKALIASESSFKPDTKTPTSNGTGIAHGLMQLTDDTINIINGSKTGLKDNFLHITFDEASEPSTNICAGVRWLFMKYAGARERIAKANLNRQATWDDGIAEYKGILKGIIENKNPDPKKEMPIFRNFYQQLSEK